MKVVTTVVKVHDVSNDDNLELCHRVRLMIPRHSNDDNLELCHRVRLMLPRHLITHKVQVHRTV